MNTNQLLFLENNMVKYQSLIKIKTIDNGDNFVAINKSTLPWKYQKGMKDMKKQFGDELLPLRFSVYEKLVKIQCNLTKTNQNLSLFLTYGYRSDEIQLNKFKQQLSRITIGQYFPNPIDLYEETHRFIAVPEVAGHPTGGAVDLLIINNQTKQPLDFGSALYFFDDKKCYTFYPFLKKKQKANRILLRDIMLSEDFAPFDGEYWHFSYGDKEWAYYYKKPYALYAQKRLKEVLSEVEVPDVI